MKRIVGLLLLCSLFSLSKAQDTLPKFNIHDINDKKILITWINPFDYHCIQLAVQRSYDSTHFFSTIYSAQSPELPQNGVVDLRMPKGVKVFYRIFYVLEGGKYYFSKSMGLYSSEFIEKKALQTYQPQKPNQREIKGDSLKETQLENTPTVPLGSKLFVYIYRTTIDTLLFKIEAKDYKQFRDSIINKTSDTLYNINQHNIIIKPFIVKPVWKPSLFVFTNENSNSVEMHFTAFKQHKYHVIFYDADSKEIFQIKNIKDPVLLLDNANFMHAGWFTFDVYEDEKLKEHNKLLLLLPF